uniref:HECT domain-containing protein n=1 Tax=Lactuca sativa TaxID=4236 RepID=A0A9R1WKN2_LACSA|nr:hypothetical protein LSAT_V11C200095020 [Lactuca sativa]
MWEEKQEVSLILYRLHLSDLTVDIMLIVFTCLPVLDQVLIEGEMVFLIECNLIFFHLYCLWGYVYLAINLLINLWLPNSQVDLNNLEEYISLVVDATVKTGITRQLEAFRAGFNQADTLVEHIKFDHGYTSKSFVVINLLEIMGEFNPEQQRAFCQFVTGAPRLPPGGLAVLNPNSNNTESNAAGGVSESADDDLPSVMTCANYLKLLPYSTKKWFFD